jgi:hypothetical protein
MRPWDDEFLIGVFAIVTNGLFLFVDNRLRRNWAADCRLNVTAFDATALPFSGRS